MEYVNLQLVDMPVSISGLVVRNDDGGYTILINSKMTDYKQKETYLHEMNHIVNRDLETFADVNILEGIRHERFSNV